MAMENKRITQLSTERLTLTSGDYVMVDDENNGSAKYRLDRLKETDNTLSVSGMAADAAATGQAISDEAEARENADNALGEDIDDLKSAIDNAESIVNDLVVSDYNTAFIAYTKNDTNRALNASGGKDVVNGSTILSYPVTAGDTIKLALVNRTGGNILYWYQDNITVPWDSNTHIIGSIHSGATENIVTVVPPGATYLVTNTDMSSIQSKVYKVAAKKGIGKNWEPLYIGSWIQRRSKANGYYDSSDWLTPYRVSMANTVALPCAPGNKLHVFIENNYAFSILFGSVQDNLNQSLYWYTGAFDITIPDGAKFYRISLSRVEDDGYGTHSVVAITPSEDFGLEVYFETDHNILAANGEAENTLTSARLYFASGSVGAITIDKYPVIAHTSDIHGDYQRLKNMYKFCDNSGLDLACITGDIVPYYPWNGMEWFEDLVLNSKTKTAVCIGNHDVADDSWSDADVYNFAFTNIATAVGNATGKTWYYTDITSKKLRAISVNLYQYGGESRWYTHFTSEQINFIVDALQTTPSGYCVIILMHSPQMALTMDSSHGEFFQQVRLYENDHNAVSGGVPIYDIVDAFISRTTLSKTYTQTGSPSSFSVSADFTSVDSNVEFVAYLTGHLHIDSVTYVSNTTNRQLMLNVTCGIGLYGGSAYPYYANLSDVGRNCGDSSQDAFNVYVIDRDTKQIKIVRIGANKTNALADRKYMAIPYST